MKAIQVISRGQAKFVDVEEPNVAPGHAVIRTSHLSLCGSDIQMLHYAAEESYPFPPGTTGHEMVGVVEQVGDASCSLRVGDRVLCLAPGHRAFCELYLAPVEHLVPLPSGKPMDILLQAQQLGTVIYALKHISDVRDKSVAVIGQGSAGLWFNFCLKRAGANRVVAMDVDNNRLERSKVYGADFAFNNAEDDPASTLQSQFGGQLPDLVVEAAGEVDSINLSTELVRKFGDILFFGYPRAQEFSFRFDELYHKCCRATTIVGASNEPGVKSMHEAVQLVANGEACAESLITHRVSFDNAIDAYEMHRTRADGAVKIVVAMPGAVVNEN